MHYNTLAFKSLSRTECLQICSTMLDTCMDIELICANLPLANLTLTGMAHIFKLYLPMVLMGIPVASSGRLQLHAYACTNCW